MALAGVTDHFIYLEDGDVADVQQQSAEIYFFRAISLSELTVPFQLFKVSARILRSDPTRITCRRKSLSSLRRFPYLGRCCRYFQLHLRARNSCYV